MRRRIHMSADKICSSSNGRNTRIESRESTMVFMAKSQQSNNDFVFVSIWGTKTKVTREEYEEHYAPLGFKEL